MSKTYRVGIIGSTGRGDYGHGVDVAFTKLANVEVAAVADPHEGGRAAAQKRTAAPQAYADYRHMLNREKLDIVGVCPRWIDQHHDMLLAAAAAGCHVYMEKPFCRTLTESDEVVRAMEMRHLKLGIAHVTQYSPVLDTVLSLIQHGEIGEVLELRGRGKEDRRGGGEDLWVLGAHVFGLMRSIAGGSAHSCTATVASKGRTVAKADVFDGPEGIGLLAGDHVQARYAFSKGVYGHFASKRGVGGSPTRFGLQIMGSRGIIEMQSGYLKPAFILRDSSWSPGRTGKTWETITSSGIGKPEARTDGTYEGGHVAAITDLIDSVEQERPTKCSAEDSRAIVEMIAAVFESHRVCGPIDLPLITRDNPLSLLQ
ncbi:MAG: Gfo/Idh/MocA family oxidoreductase [Fuerstiella sp.]|nr:Gfo/Idh/MocA family oxidoreductase [Fuerstiella sp.]